MKKAVVMDEQKQILYVDDNPLDRALVRDSLEKEHGGFILTEAKSQIEFEEFIQTRNFDLILTDFNILGYEGLQVIDFIKSNYPKIPVILVTGTGSEEVAVKAMKYGASDYIIKSSSHMQRLPIAILAAIKSKQQEEEQKQAALRQKLSIKVLEVLNRQNNLVNLITDIFKFIKDFTNFNAVAIRLKEGDDYPYYIHNTFPDHFIEKENYLCSKDLNNEIIRNKEGTPILECMCGNVIRGRTDESKEFFTKGGSFWTNNARKLFAENQQIKTRNCFISEGYESIALIPLRSDDLIIGLLQLNDKKPDCFTKDLIEFFEGIANSIGISVKRFKAEEAIKLSEKKFYDLFQDDITGDFISTIDGKMVLCNPAFAKILGFISVDEAMKVPMQSNYTNIEDRNKIIEIIKEKGKIKNYELDLIHRNGSVKRIIQNAVGIFNAQKELIQIKGYLFDITKLKQAEEELAKEQYLIKTLLENIPDSIYFKDLKSRFIRINQAMATRFKLNNSNDALGKTDRDFFKSDHSEQAYLDEQEIIKTNKPIINKEELETWLDRPPTWSSTTKMPLQNAKGEIIGTFGISRDITQRKKIEIDLQESNELNKSLLKTIPFEMDIVDEEGNILFMSQKFQNLFGTEAIGKKCWELYRDDKLQCSNCPLKEGIKPGKTQNYISEGVLGGKTFEISHTGMTYNGKKAMLEIFQDITERKQKEQELIKAKEKAEENDRLKTAFLANMSHEIRTPMNGVLGFLDLLSKPQLSNEQKEHYTAIMKKSGERLLSTISDIIELSKIESGQLPTEYSNVNIEEVLRYLQDFFKPEAKEKGLSFTLNSNNFDNELIIRTDKLKLEAILVNFIKNALKFTSKGFIELGITHNEYELIFFVKDSGIGIPKDKLDKIFDRFVQADMAITKLHDGSGLGLTISKAFAKILDGKIWVESEAGKGSTFYFSMNYQAVLKKKSKEIEKHSIIHNNETESLILIVEDDEIGFHLIEELLANTKFSLLHAENGEEAIKMVKNNPEIALILMDIKMPVMDGYEATKQIRQFNKRLPIIAQTAYAMKTDRSKALEAGFTDYITKPIKYPEIINCISKYLRNKPRAHKI